MEKRKNKKITYVVWNTNREKILKLAEELKYLSKVTIKINENLFLVVQRNVVEPESYRTCSICQRMVYSSLKKCPYCGTCLTCQ